MEIVAKLVLSRFGIDYVLKSVNMISHSANGISTAISAISSHKGGHDISKLLKRLDIQHNVRVLKTLISEINTEVGCTATLMIALNGVRECLVEIHKELDIVKKHLSYNNSLWFGWLGWTRYYNFNTNEENLIIMNEALRVRKDMLFDILGINNHLVKNKNSEMELEKLVKNFNSGETYQTEQIGVSALINSRYVVPNNI
jgi:hypothetical protein